MGICGAQDGVRVVILRGEAACVKCVGVVVVEVFFRMGLHSRVRDG